jgi:hypothetical protein
MARLQRRTGYPDITQQSRKGRVMKTVSFALLLMATLAFVVVGCSDNSTVPVSPTDQPAKGAASLGKGVITNVTLSHHPVPPFPDGTGITQVPGGIWHLKNVEAHEACTISYGNGTEESATMVHYLSSTMDAMGEGPVHGSFTMYLASGGQWEGTYEGYRSLAPPPPYPPFEFRLPLKIVGHGTGGNIDGMKLSMIDVIRATGVPPTAWFGGGEGFYK